MTRVRQTLAKVRRSSGEAALVAEQPEVALLLTLTGHPAPETPPLSEAPQYRGDFLCIFSVKDVDLSVGPSLKV